MDIIQLGINLYGYDVLVWFIGWTDENKYYSIGRKIRFMIQAKEYVAYTDVPVLYLINNEITFSEKDKFNRMLQLIIDVMIQQDIPRYKNLGIKIVYIEHRSLISNDKKMVTLANNKSPSQDRVRVLYDIIDQIDRARANVKIIYLIRSNQNDYADYYNTDLTFEFAPPNPGGCIGVPPGSTGNDIIFHDYKIGKFRYNIYTGKFSVMMTEEFRRLLLDDFRKNYPTVNNIQIYLLALEVMVNYDTVIFG